MIDGIQTPVDSWAMLYCEIGAALNRSFGAAGRSVLRQAVRDYARERGQRRRRELEQEGCDIDLNTLFSVGSDFPMDYRLRCESICLEDQRLLANVAYCPMADIWNRLNNSEIGVIYCEEFYHAYVKGALSSKCQVNVTQMLTHSWDNICRFSFYCRPANLEDKPDKTCLDRQEVIEYKNREKDVKDLVSAQWSLLFAACYRNVVQVLGEEGQTVLRDAMYSLSGKMGALLTAQFPEGVACSDCYIADLVPLFGPLGAGADWGLETSAELSTFYYKCFERILLGLLDGHAQ